MLPRVTNAYSLNGEIYLVSTGFQIIPIGKIISISVQILYHEFIDPKVDCLFANVYNTAIERCTQSKAYLIKILLP